MKHYKLSLSLYLTEVSEFDSPPEPRAEEPAPPSEDPIESIDPVKRADAVQERLLKFAERQVKAFEAKPPGFVLAAPPPAQVTLHQSYDVPADSLEEAVAMLKRFEATALEIGMPSRGQPPIEPPPFLGPFTPMRG